MHETIWKKNFQKLYNKMKVKFYILMEVQLSVWIISNHRDGTQMEMSKYLENRCFSLFLMKQLLPLKFTSVLCKVFRKLKPRYTIYGPPPFCISNHPRRLRGRMAWTTMDNTFLLLPPTSNNNKRILIIILIDSAYNQFEMNFCQQIPATLTNHWNRTIRVGKIENQIDRGWFQKISWG
jgi:hypothetical protein